MKSKATNPYGSLALLRFSKACWNSETIVSEKLRFTPIETWRKLEGEDDARGDAWEGASRVDQAENIKSVKLRFNQDPSGEWIEHKLVSGSQVVTHGTETDFPATHGICFNMLTSQLITKAVSEGKNSIDLSNFRNKFGRSLLVIQDVELFLDFVICAIRALNGEIDSSSHGSVEYIDAENHSDKYNIYKKPNRFDWQREFRIVVSNTSKENAPFFLHVPKLQNVCELITDLEPNIQLIKNNDSTHSVSISKTANPDSCH